jgi:hypothetical protein
MGNLPAFMGDTEMSDTTLAFNIIGEIGDYSQHRKANLLDRVYEAVLAYARDQKLNPPPFTARRIRAFYHREAATVSYSEMLTLADVAQHEKALSEHIKQARKSHAEFIINTARMAQALRNADEDFHSNQIAGIERGMGRVDSA